MEDQIRPETSESRLHRRVVAKVGLEELDPFIEVLRLPAARVNRLLEAVEHPHVVSAGQQGIGRVGSDESGASSYECSHE